MRTALVVGVSHHNTLGIIRSLGEENIAVDVILIDCKSSFVGESKYLSSVYYCDSNEEKLKNLLLKLAKKKTEKMVIIPADDISVMLLDGLYSELKSNFYLSSINSKYGSIKTLMNKEQMNNTAMKSGLNVAPSIAVEYKGTEDSLNEVKKIVQNSSIGYPIIIKPLYSYSGSKEMIRICNNPEELCFVISKNRVGKFLIQKYIQVIKEVGIQGVIGYDSSDVQIPGIVHKIRKAVSAQGSTTYAELNDDFLDINLENIKEFIRNIGFKGIFDIEMVSDGNDYYFIEINFRNGAYGYAYTRGGANLPLYWYNSCFGNIEHLKNINSLKYMNESADFAHVKCGEISLFKWIGEFIATDTKAIVNFKDPKPFLAKLRFWH